jgi:uncharacterized protein YjbJ (UPF0337 family)
MNKDRIEGSAKKVEGNVQIATGKVLGDSSLVAKGHVKKLEGEIQNAVGDIEDSVKR